jgi:deoxyribodipyrimidine photolyase-related protein
MKALRFILGDQLSQDISSLKGCNKSEDTILMCEVWNEATYVKHHKKKIAFLFSAMRHFAKELKESGYRVLYIKLDDKKNSGFFKSEIARALKQQKVDYIIVTHPSEYRVLKNIKAWAADFSISVEIRADDRFLCSPEDFGLWAKGRKQLRMEYFYREMRKKYNVLMEGGEPMGGQWN